MKTTLNQIRKHSPSPASMRQLLKHLGKTQADDEPLSIATILDSNGLDEALWCLRAVEGYDREIRLYAVWCARQVQHLTTDPRSITALDVSEQYALGLATEAQLAAAGATAWAAAMAMAASRAAASDAAWATAWAAAWAASRAAAEAAAMAMAASRAAASDAASDAAEAAAMAAQAARLREIVAACT